MTDTIVLSVGDQNRIDAYADLFASELIAIVKEKGKVLHPRNKLWKQAKENARQNVFGTDKALKEKYDDWRAKMSKAGGHIRARSYRDRMSELMMNAEALAVRNIVIPELRSLGLFHDRKPRRKIGFNKTYPKGVGFTRVGRSLDGPSIDVLGLSIRASNSLKRAGVYTIPELNALSDEDLGRIRNVGEKTLREIRTKREEWTSRLSRVRGIVLDDPFASFNEPETEKKDDDPAAYIRRGHLHTYAFSDPHIARIRPQSELMSFPGIPGVKAETDKITIKLDGPNFHYNGSVDLKTALEIATIAER